MQALLSIYKRAYNKKYFKYALIAIICIIIDIMAALVIPFMAKTIIDDAIPNGNIDQVIRIGAIVVSIALISVFSTIFNNICSQYIATGIASDIRLEVFEKIQDLSLSNVDQITTGKLMTIVTNDTNQIQQIIVLSFRAILRAPITLVGAMAMAYITNPDLFFVVIFGVVFVSVALFFIFKKASPLFTELQGRIDNLNSKLSETIGGAREVKAFVSELEEEIKFKEVNDEYYNANVRANKIIVMVSPLVILVSNVLIGLILYVSSHLILGGQSELTGTVMTYISYVQQIINSLMMISAISIIISRSIVSSSRYRMLMDVEIDVKDLTDELREIEGNITFEDVDFGYIDEVDNSLGITLKNINLHINKGEFIGIIGSTGSGKSSLVSLIPRLYDVNEGKLLIDGIDVKEHNLKCLRNQISLVTQEAIIFTGSILDNIKQGKLDATNEEIKNAAKIASIDDFIEGLPDKYNTHITQGGTSLSGGQKQRISIARGLIRNPKILILDDSTSAVDAKTEQRIKENLRNVQHCTIIIVAQKISSIKDCDKIIVLGNDGRVDGYNSHDNLLKTSKVYQEIFASQTGGEVDAC
ncbi:MAG: ABC transporter ATP-binding protein [Bacilli bacterium]